MGDVVEQVLAEVRALRLAVEGQRSLPSVLTMKRAAEELSISMTQLRALVKSSVVLTVTVGVRRMVPASEIRRLATPSVTVTRLERPKSSALQDPEALKRRG